jgi:hypothetical protein
MAKKTTECPYCQGQVLTKKAGRLFSTISGFVGRSFAIKIPNIPILTDLLMNTPVEKKSILKDPGKCVCKGKNKIEDPTDDSDKVKKVEQLAKQYAKELAEEAAKLAPACGNRYTIIQGCDLLEVGLGMNDAPSYRVDKDKGVRNKGLIDPSKTKPDKGGPQIPEGATANHVQGINPLASPGGHYMIKCANKFTVVAGAQGIEFNTNGPITINGGITKFTGPEVSLGSQTGSLVLEGETVKMSGKSVEVTPSDGHFFVKGTMSGTGNLMVGGHTHSESTSFVKGTCPGRNDNAKMSAPTDLYNGPAFYNGLKWGVTDGLRAGLKDMVGYATANTTNPQHAQQAATPRFAQGLNDKMTNLGYLMKPTETKPSGVILPGTLISIAGTCPCNYGGMAGGVITGKVINPTGIPLFNFPHVHAEPDAQHGHEVRVPDMDFSADNAAGVRGKIAGVAEAAPLNISSGKGSEAAKGLWSTIGAVWTGSWSKMSTPTYKKI